MTAQAGGCYGVKVQYGSGSRWLLISGATLVESAHMAAQRAPSSPQVQASLSRPLRVQRPGAQVRPRRSHQEAWQQRANPSLVSGFAGRH